MRECVQWTQPMLDHLKELLGYGYTAPAISQLMSEAFGRNVNRTAIDNAVNRYRLREKVNDAWVQESNDIKIYDDFLRLPDDNYLITADYHSPYFSVDYHNLSLMLAELFQIKKLVIGGDLVDMNFAKHFYSDTTTTLDEEGVVNKKLLESLDYFDSIYLIKGNHEHRLGRKTEGLIVARHLLEYWGQDTWNNKITYSTYDKCFIGADWMVVHPKSYSQISGAVGKRLAAKYHRNIINAHGHFLSKSYDISGDHEVYDIGGMFDAKKVEYINEKTTTHPSWNNGFAMLYNSHLYQFDDRTDWDFWLGGFNAIHQG
jgi:hypothetical protein